MSRTNSEHDYVSEHDWSSTTPSTAVLEAVASVTGSSVTDLDPLYSAVDPEALDKLVDCGPRRVDALMDVSFAYNGFDVTVTPTGTVRLGSTP